MKKIFSAAFIFLSMTVFSQSIYNSAQLGQTGRNQNVSRGFWVKSDTFLLTSTFWMPASGGAGKVFTSDANGFGTWQNISASAWSLTGNAGTIAGTNFLGTTDNVDLVFMRNSQTGGRIGTNNTSLGYLSNLNNLGTFNTAIGRNTLSSISAGAGNTAIGNNADVWNTTTNYATSIGDNAIADNFSTALGYDAVADVDSTLAIGDNIDSLKAKFNAVDGGFLRYNANSGYATYQTIPSGVALSAITAATAVNSIDNVNYDQTWSANSLAAKSFLRLTSSSTGAASNIQTLFLDSLTGTNATASQTTYAARFYNKHLGTTPVNIGIRVEATGTTVGAYAVNTSYAGYFVAGNANLGYQQGQYAIYTTGVGAVSINNTINAYHYTTPMLSVAAGSMLNDNNPMQEHPTVLINGGTKDFIGSAVSGFQRDVLIKQPTIIGHNTTVSTTNVATVGIEGAVICGSSTAIPNTHALLISAVNNIGGVPPTNSYGITCNAQTGASSNYSAVFLGGNVGIGTSAPISVFQVVGNSVTTGNVATISSSSLTTGAVLSLSSTSTASNGEKGLNISMSGANANASRTTYGGVIAVTNTGTTSDNVGLSLSASGATTNTALLFPTNASYITATGTGANGLVLKNLKNSTNTTVGGTEMTIEIDIAGTPMYFKVYSTTAP